MSVKTIIKVPPTSWLGRCATILGAAAFIYAGLYGVTTILSLLKWIAVIAIGIVVSFYAGCSASAATRNFWVNVHEEGDPVKCEIDLRACYGALFFTWYVMLAVALHTSHLSWSLLSIASTALAYFFFLRHLALKWLKHDSTLRGFCPVFMLVIAAFLISMLSML